MDDLIRRLELLKTLTPREHQVLRAICDGGLIQEIADQLGISTRTVRFHLSNIHLKFGLEGVQQAPRRVMLGGYCQCWPRRGPCCSRAAIGAA